MTQRRKADVDLTNRQQETEIGSQNSLIIFTLHAKRTNLFYLFFFLSKKPSNLQDFAVDVSDRHRRGFTSSPQDDVRLVENLKNLPGFLSYFASKNKQFMPQYLAIFKQS